MGKWVSSTVTLPAIEFDGDQIVVEARRLLTSQMSALAGNYSNGKLSFANHMEMVDAAAKVLPASIVSVSGMTAGDGRVIGKDDLIGLLPEYYFSPLVAEIIGRLIEASTVQQAEAKNSAAPLPESSGASGETTSAL